MQNTQEPKLKIIRGGDFIPSYELLEDFSFVFIHKGRYVQILVPQGFRHDGATGRWFMGWRKNINTEPETIIHDYGYSMAGEKIAYYLDNIGERFSPRKADIDNIFMSMLKKNNVSKIKRIFVRFVFKTIGLYLWKTKELGFR